MPKDLMFSGLLPCPLCASAEVELLTLRHKRKVYFYCHCGNCFMSGAPSWEPGKAALYWNLLPRMEKAPMRGGKFWQLRALKQE